jgi:feruloyl esterase
LRDVRARQAMVRDVLLDDDAHRELQFVGSSSMDDGTAAILASIRQTLKLDVAEYRAQTSAETAFALLRAKAEAAGIFVLLIGNLGSHHSSIDVEAFRGFALADKVAPFVVINDQDATTAWSFTLLHELAHLWLGKTGVSGRSADLQIEKFWRYSYWDGCSTGGKEGLTEAQRFPDDYDGVNVAGSANNAQIHNREQFVWSAQVTFGNAATPLGPALTALVNSAAIAACDELDGVKDGVIDDPLTCPFKPASLLCTQGQNPSTCLTQPQVTAFEQVYAGPRNPVTGKLIYPGYSPGTELGWGANTNGPLTSLASNFFKFMVFDDPNWNYQTFNFNTDVAFTDAHFAATLDAVNPDLRAFKRRGGKILQSHLWSSTTHAARRTVEWYDQVVSFMKNDEDKNGDDHGHSGDLNQGDFHPLQNWYRLFMAPGGSGSKGPGTFDSLPYLERWVEQGIPPDSILASHVTNGVVDRTRPLCPYPAFAVYNGSGSTDDAANFKCGEPQHVPNYFVQDNLQPEPLPASPPLHD